MYSLGHVMKIKRTQGRMEEKKKNQEQEESNDS